MKYVLPGAILFLAAAVAAAMISGSAGIPLRRVFPIIASGTVSPEYSILIDIRLPRIILGFAVGGSLSVAGVILQGMFRNPLVEPYTLGMPGGAALGAALCIILKLQYVFPAIVLPASGFIGSCLAIMPLYFVSMRQSLVRMQGILLTGVMTSFISTSLVVLILAIAKTEEVHSIVFWIMGSLEEPSWTLIIIISVIAVLGLFLSYFLAPVLNALSLGEEEAIHLGINTERTKKQLFVLASLLTGVSVSLTGIIGFVGLIVPHFVRILTGYDHRKLIVISFLTGSGFLIFCDTIARTAFAPVELPVGVITGILGGSIFIYILGRRHLSGPAGGA
ncbi:MAG: transporter, permease protein [Deltaproteobacteria bacterium]|nr:transporter, permease protein [Deltaproteobacteria bacterium]